MCDQPIFIGGTGRSGTTILKKIIGSHPTIYPTPMETRFIVDPDGIISLVKALSTDWCPYTSDKAILRFQEIMESLRKFDFSYKVMAKLSRVFNIDLLSLLSLKEYAHLPLGKSLNLIHYDKTVQNFLRQVEDFQYDGFWPGTKKFQFFPKIRVGKRYSEDEILQLSANFINDLFAYNMKEKGCNRWCDDTPYNILHSEFLLRMFPKAKIVHIYRDPRDIISSYMTQSWAPKDFKFSLKYIKCGIDGWMAERKLLSKDSFIEIQFENIISNPPKMLANLCDFLEIRYEPSMAEIDLSKHNIGRHLKIMNREQIKAIEKSCEEWMIEKGYIGATVLAE